MGARFDACHDTHLQLAGAGYLRRLARRACPLIAANTPARRPIAARYGLTASRYVLDLRSVRIRPRFRATSLWGGSETAPLRSLRPSGRAYADGRPHGVAHTAYGSQIRMIVMFV